MPLPIRKKEEDTKTFMSRCMGDSTMSKEFPDKAQRMAVCHKQFMKSGGANMDSKKEIKEGKSSSGKRDSKGRLIVGESVPVIFTGFIEVQK